MRHISLIFGLGLWLVASAAWAQAPSRGIPPVGPQDHILGKANAPITIIEYASLSCPHCAEFEKDTFPKLRAEWIDTGKARYVFRDFPLDGAALHGAIIAHCAGDARFYPMVETLFDNQDVWVSAQDPVDALKRLAKLGGVADQQADACLADKKLADSIIDSRQTAVTAGVNATPTFFVNGSEVDGALPYDAFKERLEAAVAGR